MINHAAGARLRFKFKGKGGRAEIRVSEQRDYAGIKCFVLRVSK